LLRSQNKAELFEVAGDNCGLWGGNHVYTKDLPRK